MAHANGRRVSLLLPDENLVCPNGHPFKKDMWVIGEEPSGGTRCKHVAPRAGPRGESISDNGAECGLLVYWMLWPGGMRLVVEVSSKELFEMEKAHMGVRQIRDYLGLRWTA